jgi:hypothetical protein
MESENRLCRRNISGAWYVWPIDSLLTDNELEEFNKAMAYEVLNDAALLS